MRQTSISKFFGKKEKKAKESGGDTPRVERDTSPKPNPPPKKSENSTVSGTIPCLRCTFLNHKTSSKLVIEY